MKKLGDGVLTQEEIDALLDSIDAQQDKCTARKSAKLKAVGWYCPECECVIMEHEVCDCALYEKDAQYAKIKKEWQRVYIKVKESK